MPDPKLLRFLADHFLLVAIAVVSGTMLIWPWLRRGVGGPAVSAQQATLLINRHDAVVIDLREAAEFEKSHVIGARNLPYTEIEQRAEELDRFKSRPVILVCADGVRSARAAARLRKLGIAQAVALAGGIDGWREAGLPVEKK